jgi:hypothetical protein
VVRGPRPARVWRGAADGPVVRGAHRLVRRGRRRAWPREDSEEPRGAALGEGSPRPVSSLRRRGVGADAKAARRVRVRRRGATSRRRAWLARVRAAEPLFKHVFLQKFVLKCIK